MGVWAGRGGGGGHEGLPRGGAGPPNGGALFAPGDVPLDDPDVRSEFSSGWARLVAGLRLGTEQLDQEPQENADLGRARPSPARAAPRRRTQLSISTPTSTASSSLYNSSRSTPASALRAAPVPWCDDPCRRR